MLDLFIGLLFIYAACGYLAYNFLSSNGNPKCQNIKMSIIWPVVLGGVIWFMVSYYNKNGR